ncbi:MAG: hypothetical protein ACRDKI_06870 [Solirubrobacterales bacterium]
MGVVVAAVVVVGCGESHNETNEVPLPPTPRADVTAGCAQRAQPSGFGFEPGQPGIVAVAGGGATFVVGGATPDYTGRPDKLKDGAFRFWKTPVELTAGDVALVAVAPSDSHHIRLQYSGYEPRFTDFAKAVKFKACANEKTGWPGTIVTPGGRQCVKLRIWLNDAARPRSLTVGLGRTCPAS